jgi:hypothetical protein
VDGNEHFPSWHFDAVLRFTARTSGRGSPFHSFNRLRDIAISGTSVAMIERHYGHLRSEVAASALAKLAL